MRSVQPGRFGLLAAEMSNNESVALLQAGQPGRALEAARGTDALFASASDPKRQAMALGNQAAALDALGRSDEALETYRAPRRSLKNWTRGICLPW